MKNYLPSGTARTSTLRLLRLACLVLLWTALPAVTAWSQNKEMTIRHNRATVEQVLDDISRQTNYTFFYSKEVIDINRQVSLNIKTTDINEVMAKLFEGTGETYKISGDRIYLSTKGPGTPIDATIKGRVTDEKGQPLLGVAVIVAGTSTGTISGADGRYSLNVKAVDPSLVFSLLGYETRNVVLSPAKTEVDVTMNEMTEQIDAVVVTALGITRKEKSLGYAVTKVSNEELNKTVSSNWLNSLSGKVAGLSMDHASAGPGGSIRITLRGEGSLSHDKNEALMVVDGIPIESGMGASNSGAVAFNTDAPIDYGNGASDINPEDIAEISVLKGPAATALYGSRAANGAIIITTKSGRTTPGFGVTFNSSVTFERAGFWPDFQTEYGAGNSNEGNLIAQRLYNYWNVPATAAEDGIASGGRVYARVAWGPKFEGQMFYQYESRNWETGMYKRLPWRYEENWYKGFFETGATFNNSISIENNNGKGNTLRVSVKDTRNDWIIPNTGYTSQNINVSLTQRIKNVMTFSTRVTYYRKDSKNLPMSGYNTASPLYTLIWTPNVIHPDSYYREYSEGRIQQMYEENTPTQLINSTSADNLYMQVYEQLNSLDRDRVYGNISLKIDITPKLSLDLRSGMDFSNDFRTQQKPWYSTEYKYGYYKEQTVRNFQSNNDWLLSYNNRFGDFELRVAAGGNAMFKMYQSVTIAAKDGLLENGSYTFSNSRSKPITNPYRNAKAVNSLFGFVNLGWRDMVYLDITGRNDWTSTLQRANWSYFYPSVSVSVLLNEVFGFRDKAPWVDMLKVRGSWASVGNDTDPYQLEDRYTTSDFAAGFYPTNTILNKHLKPERNESWEIGLETILFKNRLSVDVAYYDSRMKNQIITVPIDQITGGTARRINSGVVRNRGVEISAKVQAIRAKNWSWNIAMNWSRNTNLLEELAPGVDLWQMNPNLTVGGNVLVYAFPGTELGRIYGRGFERAPAGSFYVDDSGNKIDCSGQVIVTENDGYPVLTGTEADQLLDFGSIYPKWTAGLSTTLSYKNLSMSMSFSGQWGGKTYSMTHFALAYQGKLTNSLEGRYAGLIHDGVNRNADGTFQKNNTIIANVYDYYDKYIWARENVENNTFDTSFIKLKEVRLDYSLPQKIAAKTKIFQGISVGVYATNLFCISNFPFYDPEAGATVGSSIVRGIEAGAYPMTRTYGLNIKLNF